MLWSLATNFFFSSRSRHTCLTCDWSSDVCSSDLACPLHPSPGACSLRWSSPSLLSQTVKGWHARPGKETVTINLFMQEDRSPSGTGRAQFQTHANDQRASDRNVQGTTNTMVDP